MGEWTSYININSKIDGTASAIEYSTIPADTGDMLLSYLIPTNSVKGWWLNTWNTTQGIGHYFAGTNGSGGALVRGGDWGGGLQGGVFSAKMAYATNSTNTGIGFRCVQNLGDYDPSDLTLEPGNGQVKADWTNTAATGYLLVRGAVGSAPTWMPTDGTPYSPGAQTPDEVVFVGNAFTYTDTGLTNHQRYEYALYSYDGGNNYTPMGVASENPMGCPADYVLVPGDEEYGTNDFCVMKYEAKCSATDGSTCATTAMPQSSAVNTPWVNISQELAITKCAAIEMGAHLMTNDEWMTITANAANVDTNWDGGSVGTGSLYVGHSDNAPSTACKANTTDANAYVESDCVGAGSGGAAVQRRTLNLSNGQVIWDISGNVNEWVDYFNTSGQATPADASVYEYTSVVGSSIMAMDHLIPNLKSWWISGWDSSYGIGMYTADPSGGAMTRGGAFSSPTGEAGMFQADMTTNTPTSTDAGTGFRCVRNPL